MDNFNAAEAAARLMALEQMQGAPGVPGMPGTPGGPVQESPTMQWMRDKQMIRGMMQAGAGLPIGYAGVSTGSLPFALGGGLLASTGIDNMTNSYAPNIRDVYDDQYRMKMQGN